MYRSSDTHQLSILLRISSELDIVGDVTATVDGPADLVAWATLLPDPTVCAWRSGSGHCYVQVTARHHRLPVHGRVTAVLNGDQHTGFWHALVDPQLAPGEERVRSVKDLSRAWEAMPLTAET